MDPHSFTVILQSQLAGDPFIRCYGFAQLAAVRPTRILVVGDPCNAATHNDLLELLRERLASGTGVGEEACPGPGGWDCWASDEPGVRNLLVVVAGDAPPTTELDELVTGWQGIGYETLGIFRAGLNPDNVLPAPMRAQHAPSWQADVREVASDIIDSVVLGGEDRRVFISYAHADGGSTAERLATILNELRFDVFLDRFRLPPGVDFIERINDELLDKAMVVLVETADAVRSTWVQYEVTTAVSRRLGLAAVNLWNGPTIAGIDELARCRVDDNDAIAAFVVEQHRSQLRERREALLDSVWHSLCRAGIAREQLTPDVDGFRVEEVGAGSSSYTIAVCTRPADLRRFRLVHERAGTAASPVVVHPLPVRTDRRRDLEWLTENSGVVDVDEGLIDEAADLIAAGTL